MKQFTQQLYNQLFYQAPKRSVGVINNLQSLEAPTSGAVFSNVKIDELIKSRSIPSFNTFNGIDIDSQLRGSEGVAIENNKRPPITFSPSASINFNSYSTPPASPKSCEEVKPKIKKIVESRSIGINTIESKGYEVFNKFRGNLCNISIFFFISISFIELFIIFRMKNNSNQKSCINKK